jgi:hypothetical protein
MAQVVEEIIVLKISRLARKNENGEPIITPDIQQGLAQLVEDSLPDLTGVNGLIVEAELAEED